VKKLSQLHGFLIPLLRFGAGARGEKGEEDWTFERGHDRKRRCVPVDLPPEKEGLYSKEKTKKKKRSPRVPTSSYF